MVPAGLVSGETSLLGLQAVPSLCPYMSCFRCAFTERQSATMPLPILIETVCVGLEPHSYDIIYS